MTDGTVTPPPGPAHLSDAARAAIEQPIVRVPFPAVDDRAGWEQHVRGVNGFLSTVLPQVELPLRSELQHPGGVPTYVITPHAAADDSPVYLDIHGGALLYGGGDLTRVIGEFGAMGTGLVHWAVDYRMPPADPFPAGLEDLVTVYRALLDTREPSQIVIGGGSAGGNLAAALTLRIKAADLPMPAALVLLTPQVDLTESGDTFTTLVDVSVGLQSLMDVNLLYAAGRPLEDPYLSPLFGDLGGFPPTLLITGTRDLFLSNTVRMHRALREAGVFADLHVIDARPHVGFGGAPEEQAVSAEIRAFVRVHVGLDPD